MKSFDIVGYVYRADTYCPSCTVEEVFAAYPEAEEKLANASSAPTYAADLARIARVLGIDWRDEHTFDSDDFPKVIFADSVEDSDERCGRCFESLIDGDETDEEDEDA